MLGQFLRETWILREDVLEIDLNSRLDEGIDEALREFVARKKGEMLDKWY